MNIIESIQRVFQHPELRQKIGITLALIVACRIGSFIPVPGVDGQLAEAFFKSQVGNSLNLFQLINTFSGGAFSQMTVTALGVLPYISASIILQLVMALMPSLQREMRENAEYGKRKMGRWTRMLTLGIALFQSALYASYALGTINASQAGIIIPEILQFKLMGFPWLYYMLFMITMSTGTLLLMWIGEQISEFGVGNGISLIIGVNILSSLPGTIARIVQQLNLDSQDAGQLSLTTFFIMMVIFVLVTMATILLIQAQRNVPVQYARRSAGKNMQQQVGSSFLPLKLNYAGVIPVIFGNSILMFPAVIGQFLPQDSTVGSIIRSLSPGTWAYTLFFVFLIIFFSYFWTATQFHPEQIASDMKKNGAFIPGVRQGRPTQEFLEGAMNRITLFGSVALALLAVFPMMVAYLLNVDQGISHFFGGTSLLILVGVCLDTMKQVESHMMMKRYDGLMRRSRLKPKKA